jgi:rhamnulose-1-phosphate aldolase
MNIQNEFNRIAEVAGYLWQKNWAERNGGNISVNLSHLTDEETAVLPALTDSFELAEEVPGLAGNIFYVTGTGTRMRDVAKAPMEHGSVLRITKDARHYEIIADKAIQPTSELSSHLAIHNFMQSSGKSGRVVLHTHPTELIALTHCPPFLDAAFLTRTLWSMIPETRVFVPKGVGVVPYTLTGTRELAHATIRQLEHHDVVLWEKHGAIAVGEDVVECFDVLDTLSKSALIYLTARTAGFEPSGLTAGQLDELSAAFHLPPQPGK